MQASSWFCPLTCRSLRLLRYSFEIRRQYNTFFTNNRPASEGSVWATPCTDSLPLLTHRFLLTHWSAQIQRPSLTHWLSLIHRLSLLATCNESRVYWQTFSCLNVAQKPCMAKFDCRKYQSWWPSTTAPKTVEYDRFKQTKPASLKQHNILQSCRILDIIHRLPIWSGHC